MKNKKVKLIFKALLFLVGVFLMVFGESIEGEQSLPCVLIGCAILIYYHIMALVTMVKWLFIEPNQKKQEKLNAQNIARLQVKEIVSYENKTLRLKAQNKYLSDMIDIVAATTTTVYKNPEKIHVGAVTVGGVTTGGVYKTGGELYGKTVTAAGRYEILYDGKEVERIYLTDDLAQKAQASEIKEYCDGKSIIVVEQIRRYSDTALMLAKAGDMLQLNQERAQGYPTLEKANAIIEWITKEV